MIFLEHCAYSLESLRLPLACCFKLANSSLRSALQNIKVSASEHLEHIVGVKERVLFRVEALSVEVWALCAAEVHQQHAAVRRVLHRGVHTRHVRTPRRHVAERKPSHQVKPFLADINVVNDNSFFDHLKYIWIFWLWRIPCRNLIIPFNDW